MLFAALGALILAATPAHPCAKCDEVRGLVDKYPVLAEEIRGACAQVLAMEPAAPCAETARLAVEAAERVIARERCADCTAAIEQMERAESFSRAAATRVRERCDTIRSGPCADAAREAESKIAARFHADAELHVTKARAHSADGEIYLALQELQRARAIERPEGADLELMTYEKAARTGLETLFQEAVEALDRNDHGRAMEIHLEISRIGRPLGMPEYEWRVLVEVMKRRPPSDRGRVLPEDE